MALFFRRIKKNELLPFITALLLLCVLSPFYVWKLLTLNLQLVRGLLTFICCWPFILNMRKITQKDTGVVFVAFLAVLTYTFVAFIHEFTLLGLLARLLSTFPVLILFSKKDFLVTVFECFFTLYSIMMLLAIISYILFLFGISPELGTIPSPIEIGREYLHYPFFVIEWQLVDTFRFGGPFDEPGVLGTISALLLCVKKYDLKDLRSIITFVSGLLSTSLFFYLMSFIFFIYYFLIIKKSLIAILSLTILLILLFSYTKEDPIIYDRVWSRIEWDSSNHQLKGDSRTSIEAKNYYKETIGSFDWFWGLEDPTRYKRLAIDSSTYMNVIMWNGAIFFFLYLFFLILFVNCHIPSISKRVIVYIVIFVNMYQRPDIYGAIILFLYSCIVYMDKTCKNNKEGFDYGGSDTKIGITAKC